MGDTEVDVPTDVLRIIFSKLPVKTLCNIARVCSRWNTLCLELWEDRVYARWGREISAHGQTGDAGAWLRTYARMHQVMFCSGH